MVAAANGNNGQAQYDLAIAHMNGDGVPKDYAEAYFWLSVCSCSGGIFWSPSPAELAADIVREIFGEDSLFDASVKARKWIELHGPPVADDY